MNGQDRPGECIWSFIKSSYSYDVMTTALGDEEGHDVIPLTEVDGRGDGVPVAGEAGHGRHLRAQQGAVQERTAVRCAEEGKQQRPVISASPCVST